MQVAIFTPELPINEDIPHYGGGLGILFLQTHSAFKANNLDAVFVSLLYTYGYYHQDITKNVMSVSYNRIDNPLHDRGTVSIKLGKNKIFVKVWEQQANQFGGSRAIFLDTNIDKNDETTRQNTLHLYGGHSVGNTAETKIAQSIILARAGLKALKLLKIEPNVYHANGSHAGFLPLEMIAGLTKKNTPFDEAGFFVRHKMLFTLHTPVPAGNPRYDIDTVCNLADYNKTTLTNLPFVVDNKLDMAGIGYYYSHTTNAVAKKHQEVSKKIFAWIKEKRPLTHVTNGQNQDFWQMPEFKNAVTPKDIQHAKIIYKNKLIEHVAQKTSKKWLGNVLTVVWARRFAEYKRPMLITKNQDWLTKRLQSGSLQLLIAGKPHPDDITMIETWNTLRELSNNYNALAVIEGYEIPNMKLYKAGADIWLNTPRAPHEASGTSGMGAGFNATINVSTPDGWCLEATPKTIYLFGSQHELTSTKEQDDYDSRELMLTLDELMDLYYKNENDHKSAFYARALRTKLMCEKKFTTTRMIADYKKLYDKIISGEQ